MATKYASSLASGGGAGTFADPYTLAELIAYTPSAGDDLRLIADGTYTRSATWAPTVSGTAAANIYVRGCNSSDGSVDGTKATIQASAGSFTIFNLSSVSHWQPRYLIFDGNSQTTSVGFNLGGSYNRAYYIDAKNTTSKAIVANGGNSQALLFCTITGCSTRGFELSSSTSTFGCRAYANSCSGFYLASGNGTAMNCYSYNNTGSAHGFENSSVGYNYYNCVAYGNAGDGFNLDGNAGFGSYLTGCVAYGNTGEGFGTDGVKDGVILTACAGGSNTAGNYSGTNITNVADFTSLTGNPFIDAANGDFNINNTSGAGAALRAVTLTI